MVYKSWIFINSFKYYLVNILSKTIGHRDSPHEDPVVLVGGLGQTHNIGLFGDSLSKSVKSIKYWSMKISIATKILHLALTVLKIITTRFASLSEAFPQLHN